MSPVILLFIALAILVGAFAQRTTGMGVALVAAPFLVLLLGPFSGILVINLMGVFSTLLILSRLRHDVEWKTYSWLVGPALVGVLPGSWLAHVLPSDWLQILIGLLLIAALSVSLMISRMNRVVAGAKTIVIAGFASGVMNAAAGVGGPAVSVYGVLSSWPQRNFAATLQPFFTTIASASVITKFLMNPAGWPQLDWWAWLIIFTSLIAGLAIGDVSAKWISSSKARTGVIVIAFAGASAAVGKGILTLLA